MTASSRGEGAARSLQSKAPPGAYSCLGLLPAPSGPRWQSSRLDLPLAGPRVLPTLRGPRRDGKRWGEERRWEPILSHGAGPHNPEPQVDTAHLGRGGTPRFFCLPYPPLSDRAALSLHGDGTCTGPERDQPELESLEVAPAMSPPSLYLSLPHQGLASVSPRIWADLVTLWTTEGLRGDT
ncbi:hypothetical protein H1C71_025599 [Ictidomys tridecemlineatus]|nr:hypothetical protein H1C71_025599 [Ictidomys tridecemlineatus]KAG3289258.1 hypothetical protein H1C71_025599 [Ictidomys tridecemlineatus]KAG3289259.1 hypothetical protein H1C71_025599 [Ictidomys tridecemlineatus]